MPCGIVKVEKITALLNRIYAYLNIVTPTNFINSKTGETLTDLSEIDENSQIIKLLKTHQFEINDSTVVVEEVTNVILKKSVVRLLRTTDSFKHTH